MSPTLDFLKASEGCIAKVLSELRPLLLEAQGKISHKLKDDKTAVTEMDTLVESRLQQALAAFAPEIGFSGEETGVDYSKQTFWLVDPIDGTEPFIRGLPFATNMIALIDGGEPVLGVVNNFGTGEYYLAIKGQGATRNGHPIRVSDRPLGRSFVCTSTPGKEATHAWSLQERLRHELGINAIVKFAATGAELMAVADGAIEARIAYGGRAKPWDWAPGALIVQEAGGRVANLSSDVYDYRNSDVLAATPQSFDALMQFMTELQATAK